CTAVTSLTLPAKTVKLGANAFNGCKKLKKLTIKSKKMTKKTVAKNAFKGLTRKTKIKAPKAKVKTYKKLFRKRGLSGKVKVTK
ncbi:MAG: leucine-rich repeat protein, partial [bacterium]|nr:leucine-rich repeat protein [bacterium]